MMPRPNAARLLLPVILLAAPLAAQNRAATTLSAGDSAIIARELAAWDALQKKDSGATFTRVVGNSPTWIILGPDGITRQPAATIAREITTNCERPGKNQLDSARVDHVTDDVVLLTYKIAVSERCRSDSTSFGGTLYSMTVWARRNGRWQIVAQAWAPKQQTAR
jgi:hypothetical protein